jgi:hypothetical protein
MSHTFRKNLYWYYDPKGNRDCKKWFKPDKKFKTILKQKRKAKEKEALKLGKEIIPEFPKTDVWEWN